MVQKFGETRSRFLVIWVYFVFSLFGGVTLFGAGDIQPISFVDTKDPVASNGELSYLIEVKNNKGESAESVELNMTVPEGFTFVSVNAEECSYTGDTPSDSNDSDLVECSFGDFSASESRDINITLRAPIVEEPIVFEANATASCKDDDNTANDSEKSKTTVVKGADLLLTKTGTPNPAVASGIVTYEMNVTNNGPHDATNVQLTDTLPDVLSFYADNAAIEDANDSDWQCSAAGQDVTCLGGNIAVGETSSFHFRVKITGAETGTITNAATVISDVLEVNSSNNTDTDDLEILPGTDIGVEILVLTNPVIEEENVTFELNVTNFGQHPAQEVRLEDILHDTGYSVVEIDASGWECSVSDNHVSCEKDEDLAVGESSILTITATAPKIDEDQARTDDNNVSISTKTDDPIEENDNDRVLYTVWADQADLEVSKSKSPTPIAVDDIATSTIVVQNHGPREATPVQIVDVLDSSEAYDSFEGEDWDCSESDGTVTCDYANALQMGEYAPTLLIKTKALEEDDDINNRVCTGGSGGSAEPDNKDTYTDNDCDSAGIAGTSSSGRGVADIRLLKSASDDVISPDEEQFSYLISVKNIEGNTSKDVILTDHIPQYIEAFGSRSATGLSLSSSEIDVEENCTIEGADIFCHLGDMALGDEINLTIEVTRPMKDDSRTNTASAYSTEIGDTNRTNNQDSATVKVENKADIEVVSKIVTPSEVLAGTEATYTILIRNNGPSIAKDVNLSDHFFGDSFTFLEATTSKGDLCVYDEESRELNCTLLDLGYGDVESITVKIRPDHLDTIPDPWEINNTAQVTMFTPDSNLSNNEKNATLLVKEGEVDLAIKIDESEDFQEPVPFDPEDADALNYIVYRVEIGNNGPSYATDVNFSAIVTSVSPDNDQNLTFKYMSSHSDGSSDDIDYNCTNEGTTFHPADTAPVIECAVGNMYSGTSLVYYLIFKVEDAPHDVSGDVYHIESNVTAREVETLMGNNEEDEKTTVRVITDPSIVKKVSKEVVEVGEPFSYTLIVTNKGPGYSPTTNITDELPEGMVLLSTPTTTQGSCQGEAGESSFSCNVDEEDGTLHSTYKDEDATDEANITVSVMFTSYPYDGETNTTVTNTAYVTTTGPDKNESNNVSSASVMLMKPAHIGDRVWLDRDADGRQDYNEVGIEGVEVYLILEGDGSVVQTTTTNSDGLYGFDINHSDDYRVEFNLTDINGIHYDEGELFITEQNSSDDDKDSDINASGITEVFSVHYGDNNLTIDAGLYRYVNIGDWVWIDDNGDGIQSDDEVGMADVNITLWVEDDTGDYVRVTHDIHGDEIGIEGVVTTDVDGKYLFTKLPPANYYVEFNKSTLPPKYVFTTKKVEGSSYATDSNADRDTGETFKKTVLADKDIDDIYTYRHFDAGIYIPVSIGDHTWVDEDGDGEQNSSEHNLSDVNVTLMDAGCSSSILEDQNGSNAFVNPLQTDENGSYLFSNLKPDTYCLKFTAPDGSDYVVTQQDEGDNDSNDSDPDGFNTPEGTTTDYVLTSDEDNRSVDAGFYLQIHIGDRVWEDANYNGLQESDEANVSDVRVNLIIDGVLQDDIYQDTNSSGEYLFDELPPGHAYSVRFTNLPEGYRFTQQDVGDDDTLDSDVNATGYASGATPVTASEDENLTFDAGIYKPIVIGDRVWEDTDANGIQDAYDWNLSGVVATIVIDGVVYDDINTTTDENGTYLFDIDRDLKPNHRYAVKFSGLPQTDRPYLVAPKDSGSDDTLDSDINETNITTSTPVMFSGESNLTLDAGYYRLGLVGDRVWNDANGDGNQTSGEEGVSDVNVTLWDASTGTQVKEDAYGNTFGNDGTLITNSEGIYHFDNLMPGKSYYVTFDKESLPEGYTFTQLDEGDNDYVDSDANRTTGKTTSLYVYSNDNRTWMDAGIYKPVSIGDHTWVDENGNGMQEAKEANLSDVNVTLMDAGCNALIAQDQNGSDAFVNPLQTDENGYYLFENLKPDTYCLKFTAPEGSRYLLTKLNQGDDSNDSDANGFMQSEGSTEDYILVSGEENRSVDTGFFEPVSVGDYVWVDSNYNGVQESSETNVSDMNVTLYRDGDWDTPLQSVRTDENGSYHFDGLPAGHTYGVEFNLTHYNDEHSTSYRFTLRDAEDNDAKDSDANLTSGQTPETPLMRSGESNVTLDGGIYEPIEIGNYIWHDTNANGVQESGEEGIEGVVVTLVIDGVKQSDITATTNSEGAYLFDKGYDLKPGHRYSIDVARPDDTWHFSPSDSTQGDDSTDSDVDSDGKGVNETPVMHSGESNITFDAGLYHYATIGDRIWLDADLDGVQDDDEENLSGVDINVTLYDKNNNKIASQVVSNGAYLFDEVIPGEYYLHFSLPDNYAVTTQDASEDDEDSDVNASTLKTAIVSLSSNQEDITWDMGVYEYASMGDRIWLDSNANGIQEEGEENLSGVDVNVTLYDDEGTQIDSQVVNDGAYLFTEVVPGAYYVHFTLPTGYVLSAQNSTEDTTLDSDVNESTFNTKVTTLASGENNLTWDMGVYENVTIGDRIWLDTNADGVQDEGEENVSVSITVKLLDENNDTVETNTTENGAYRFSNIIPGTYHLAFSLPEGYVVTTQESQEADDSNNSDVNRSTLQTQERTFNSGDDVRSIDMGLFQTASIGDRIWLDTNANGVQDEGEENLSEEVTVYLEDENNNSVEDVDGNLVEKNTTTNGVYAFSNLRPGAYHLRFEFPEGMEVSVKDATSESEDSDVDAESHQTETTTLRSGEHDFSWDAGVYTNASIGDYIWVDANGNGIQDDAENALEENITVVLYKSDDTKMAEQIVEAKSDGAYSFDGIKPDDYYVKFVLADGSAYRFVAPYARDDNSVDSDVNVTTGKTNIETISSGEVNNTLDAGVYVPASLGDRVWLDANANGIQEAGESNLSDINVTLYDDENHSIAMTTTDENGSYLFAGLLPSTYHLQFALEDSSGTRYVASPKEVRSQGTEENNDSDVNASGYTQEEVLVSGEQNRMYDAGLYRLVAIGNYVWSDANMNGLQDEGEEGLSDVNVSLYRVESDGSSTFMASQETNSSGEYLFSNLVPATYYVKVVKPAHYQTTKQFEGEDETIDSNIDYESAESQAFALRSPEDNMSIDAGYYALATIKGSVLEDSDNDDIGDTPIEGVILYLVDEEGERVAQQQTDSDGNYLFIDVEPGRYTIEEVQPEAMVSLSENEGGSDNDAGDDTLNNSIAVSVNVAEVDSENDFVEERGIYLGDRVWFDENGDGIQDSEETNSSMLEGIEVNLYSEGEIVASTTTNDEGYYLFENYPDGSYMIEFNLSTLPEHYAVTKQFEGADESNDSDVNATTFATRNATSAMTRSIEVDAGEHNITLDMGIYKMGSVSGMVRADIDGDGSVDGNADSVLSGVCIELLNTSGEVIATTYTDENGHYIFEDIPQGSYIVREIQPDGYLDINATGGEESSEDANLISVNLHAGVDDDNNDFNDKLSGRIGDYVWHDNGVGGDYHEANGIQDADENGTNGVRICLEDTEGNPIVVSDENQTQRCTVTDANGYYEFVGLMPNSYVVVFAIPEGTALTPYPQEGEDDTKDSNPIETMIQEGGALDGLEVAKADVTLEPGDQIDTIDMGLVYPCTGKIGDRVWVDSNRNGIFDAGEEGLDDVHVRLYDAEGHLREEYITHDGGYYIFEHLCEGEYTVEFILPRDWAFVDSNIESNGDEADSDADVYTGRTMQITLAEGEHQRTWDAGVYCQCEEAANSHDSGDAFNTMMVLLFMLMTLFIASFYLKNEGVTPRRIK